MSVVTDLQQFGLSEKEARIYVSLLEFKKAVVSEIAKKAGLNRSTSYILLEALKERGLVSVSEKNNVQYFSALPPEKLKELAEDALQRSKELVSLSKNIVKDLSGKYKGVGERPELFIYEGEEGIEEAKKEFKKDSEKGRLVIDKKRGFAYILKNIEL